MFLARDGLPPHGETDGSPECPGYKEDDFWGKRNGEALPTSILVVPAVTSHLGTWELGGSARRGAK